MGKQTVSEQVAKLLSKNSKYELARLVREERRLRRLDQKAYTTKVEVLTDSLSTVKEDLENFTKTHVGLVAKMREEIEELRATGFHLRDALEWTWKKNDFLRHEVRVSEAERQRARKKIYKDAGNVLARPDSAQAGRAQEPAAVVAS